VGDSALVRSDKLYRLRQIERKLPGIVENLVISGLLPLIVGLVLFDIFFFYALGRFGLHHLYVLKEQRQDRTRRFLDILQEIAYKLKTPITDLSWTIEKARQNIAAVSPQEVQDDFSRLAEYLDEDTAALKRKSNQLLRLIQVYRPQFKNTALKPVLEKMVERFRTLAGEKIKIRFSMDEDVSLNIDEELFNEALSNVLDNALEAIPGAGTVTLSAVVLPAALKRKARQVLIEVEDTGQGINKEDLTRVFEPFFSRKEATGGSGLGLTICRYIVAVHGGEIDIHSRKGFGARVQITLPVDGVKVER
jgi:polar amino acid transport system substrate-binding protein